MEDTVYPVEPNKTCLDESTFPNEMLSWYQDDTSSTQNRTATLV